MRRRHNFFSISHHESRAVDFPGVCMPDAQHMFVLVCKCRCPIYMAHAYVTRTERFPEQLHVPIPTVPLLPGLILAADCSYTVRDCSMNDIPLTLPYIVHSPRRQASTEVKRGAKHDMAHDARGCLLLECC